MRKTQTCWTGKRTGIVDQIRAFLLERGIAVRQGQRFLRAELPRILATPPDVLSPRMARVIEDLAGDWRRLDRAHRRAVSGDRSSGPRELQLRAADQRARHWADHLQRDGGRDRCWRCLQQRPRLCRLGGLRPKQMSTGDRTILGKISKRGNRYLLRGFYSVQAAWVVLIKPNSWERYGLKPWIEAAQSGCTATCWRLRWPTSSLASPGVYWLAVEASRCGRWKQRPSLRDPYSAPRWHRTAQNEEPAMT